MSWPGTGSDAGPPQPQDEPSLQRCIPVPASLPPAAHPLAELSPGRAHRKIPSWTGMCFGGQAGPGPGPSVAEAGEVTVTMPGGMAGARPEPPEEGTKPGPARVACPCSWKRALGIQKREGQRRAWRTNPCFSSLLSSLCNVNSSKGGGDIPRVAPVPTLPWGVPVGMALTGTGRLQDLGTSPWHSWQCGNQLFTAEVFLQGAS